MVAGVAAAVVVVVVVWIIGSGLKLCDATSMDVDVFKLDVDAVEVFTAGKRAGISSAEEVAEPGWIM